MAFAEYDRYDGLGLAELVREGEVSASKLLDEAIARAERVGSIVIRLSVQGTAPVDHRRAILSIHPTRH